MPARNPPAAPPTPAATPQTPVEAPPQKPVLTPEAQNRLEVVESLKDGQMVRVSLVHSWPMWCHSQNTRISPGDEPKVKVDRWVRANLLRGNIALVE